jgi:pimeloyl-ACP methyl ester carboxylesterase
VAWFEGVWSMAGEVAGMAETEEMLVPFAGPTFVNRWTLGAYMGSAIMRHPNFRLMPLPRIGSVSVATSAKQYGDFVRREVGPDRPYVAAGQSQGGIIAALHALTDPNAKHVILLDAPLNGAWLSRLLLIFPSARELLAGSAMLTDLQQAILEQPTRFTSIFCPQEQVMDSTSPYLAGIPNILVGSPDQLKRYAQEHPEVEPTEYVESEHAVTHTSAMRNPDFRRVLWQTISREAAMVGRIFV